MANVFDVSEWFLQKEPSSHKKIQKLCYYTQAWHFALNGIPLLYNNDGAETEFEAWVHGPVSPVLYDKFSGNGWNNIAPEGKVLDFSRDDEELLESIWLTYGNSTGNALEALSHTEWPWIKARIGYGDLERCNVKINEEDMKTYYKSIYLNN